MKTTIIFLAKLLNRLIQTATTVNGTLNGPYNCCSYIDN